jgi:hypothetical protein
MDEFLEVDGSILILVNLEEQVVDLVFRDVRAGKVAEVSHHHCELISRDGSVRVDVHGSVDVLELNDFLGAKSWLIELRFLDWILGLSGWLVCRLADWGSLLDWHLLLDWLLLVHLRSCGGLIHWLCGWNHLDWLLGLNVLDWLLINWLLDELLHWLNVLLNISLSWS